MQKSFADLEYAAKRKTTRRERFLMELERITPWSELLAVLAPFYPKGEGRGRPPIGLERMLRMNVCCFSAAPREWNGSAQDDLNAKITSELQLSGDAVFSTTKLDGRTVIRAALTNHRTCADDIVYAIGAVARVRDAEIGC